MSRLFPLSVRENRSLMVTELPAALHRLRRYESIIRLATVRLVSQPHVVSVWFHGGKTVLFCSLLGRAGIRSVMFGALPVSRCTSTVTPGPST